MNIPDYPGAISTDSFRTASLLETSETQIDIACHCQIVYIARLGPTMVICNWSMATAHPQIRTTAEQSGVKAQFPTSVVSQLQPSHSRCPHVSKGLGRRKAYDFASARAYLLHTASATAFIYSAHTSTIAQFDDRDMGSTVPDTRRSRIACLGIPKCQSFRK